MEKEAGTLREESGHLRELRGDSEAMVDLRGLVERAARSSANVLLHGERGTGKELVARVLNGAGLTVVVGFAVTGIRPINRFPHKLYSESLNQGCYRTINCILRCFIHSVTAAKAKHTADTGIY